MCKTAAWAQAKPAEARCTFDVFDKSGVAEGSSRRPKCDPRLCSPNVLSRDLVSQQYNL